MKFWNIPNTVCVVRTAIIPVAIVLMYFGDAFVKSIGIALILLSFILDGIDGYIARKLKQETTLGSLVDVIADRITEYMLWVFFSGMGIIPLWAPLIVIPRGVLTDTIRSIATTKGISVYDLPKSKIAKFLVTSRVLRLSIGASKMILFTLAGIFMVTNIPRNWIVIMSVIVVLINVARGLPVIAEANQVLQ